MAHLQCQQCQQVFYCQKRQLLCDVCIIRQNGIDPKLEKLNGRPILWSCTECSAYFRDAYFLERHITESGKFGKHVPRDRSGYRYYEAAGFNPIIYTIANAIPCPNCNKRYGSEYALKRHFYHCKFSSEQASVMPSAAASAAAPQNRVPKRAAAAEGLPNPKRASQPRSRVQPLPHPLQPMAAQTALLRRTHNSL